MPLISSPTRFNDPTNYARIESGTEQLKTLAHGLRADNSGAQVSTDPTLNVMSGLFEEDIDRALQALRTGNRDFARGMLNDTTSYCIQCHTQTANGPEFPRLKLSVEVKELNPLERAQFFTAHSPI